MPLPTANDVHVDGVRTEMSIAYMNDREFMAADAIAPILSVDKQSDKFAIYSQADFMRLQAQIVAENAPAPEMSFGVTTDSYFCDTYSGKAFLSDRKRSNARGEFEIEQAYVNFVTHQLLIKREAVVAAAMWTTGVWGTDSTPGTKWSAGSSDPFGNLRTGCRTIQAAIGKWPTDLILGADVWDTLADHADTIARISGGATASEPVKVMPEMIAGILGLKRVTIAAATYNSASAGVATATMTQLYDTNDALLVYRPDTPSQFEPSGGYSFSWAEFDEVRDGAAAIMTDRTWDPAGEWFKGQMSFVPKITCSAAGYFFNEATS